MSKGFPIYFAAPLFTTAEQRFNADLRDRVYQILHHQGVITDIMLPQERCAQYVGQPQNVWAHNTAYQCQSDVREADIIIAILGGPDADSGACWEVGYAFGLSQHAMNRKKIICVLTDLRESGDDQGSNLMLTQSCDSYIRMTGTDIEPLAHKIADEIIRLRAEASDEVAKMFTDG